MFLFTEYIQNLTLSTSSGLVKEGTESFSLQYSMLQGVFEQQMWFFRGTEIKTSSRYIVKTEAKSLVILQPNRNDAGEYAVLLTNPFRNAMASKNVTVWCKFNNLKMTNSSSFIFFLVYLFISLSLLLTEHGVQTDQMSPYLRPIHLGLFI